MRSKLFVPGSRPELFAKALVSEADAISIDLEDSVVDDRKDEARAYVAEFLQSADVLSSDKIIIIRCNALGTEHFDADMQALIHPALHMLNLPKAESATDIRIVAEALQQAEARNEFAEPISILATIETPAGLRCASKIAAAHPRVGGLQLGLNDLFGALDIDRGDAANVHAAMLALRMAAGEAGVLAVDGAYGDILNEQGFRAEAAMARRLGFCGKSCIHPSQVNPANEVFTPSDEAVAAAMRVLEASANAALKGMGAFTVDGKMIDLPSIRHAKLIVAASKISP